MDKKISGIIIVAIIIILVTGALYVAFIPTQTDYAAQLQSQLETKWQEYGADKPGFDGSIAAKISSPKGDFFVYTGLDQNITENTHFRIGSTTKTFTTAAILLLQQDGLLQIDDYITDLIPGKDISYVPTSSSYDIPFKDQITIRQLLGHRAGVFDVTNDMIPENASAPYAGKYYINYIEDDLAQPDHTFTFDEMVGVVALNQLAYFPPETAFHYSNTGYSILAKIIEQVSGMSYAEFVEQRLLIPNGLLDTFIPVSGTEQQLPSPYTDGYVWYEGELFQATEANLSPNAAEGNIISTLNNLNKWVTLLYTSEVGVNSNLVDQMMDVTTTGEEHEFYGLGTVYTAGLGYGHNGAHIGYLTMMRYDPGTKVSVTIFISVWNIADIYSEVSLTYDFGNAAKQILGYS